MLWSSKKHLFKVLYFNIQWLGTSRIFSQAVYCTGLWPNNEYSVRADKRLSLLTHKWSRHLVDHANIDVSADQFLFQQHEQEWADAFTSFSCFTVGCSGYCHAWSPHCSLKFSSRPPVFRIPSCSSNVICYSIYSARTLCARYLDLSLSLFCCQLRGRTSTRSLEVLSQIS